MQHFSAKSCIFYDAIRFCFLVMQQWQMVKEYKMPQDRICKTIRQYSKDLISDEDMEKLQEIADGYKKTKRYVYARYGGIGSLSKIYPGYSVQNEMTESGFRKELGLPSVYFYLAVFEAAGDIRGQWEKTKAKIRQLVSQNENLAEEEKHYLRFLLKVKNAFEAVLNQNPIELPEGLQRQYEKLAERVETDRLNRYLCRQVRKVHKKCGQEDGGDADGFAMAERAYRYGEKTGRRGVFISIKEQRKRIFISLTDGNQYKSQLYVKLYPNESRLEIHVPINVSVRKHLDYQNKVGVSLGMYTMLTTDQGHSYGDELGRYQVEYAGWLREQAMSYSCNRENNPGRKKYNARKKRMEERLHSYINQELNRFFRQEKPGILYIAKMPKPQRGGANPGINHSVGVWQRGYIQNRLMLKGREQSVEIVEVLGKDISRECSSCGGTGDKKDGKFVCRDCGQTMEEKHNTARNVYKRGEEGKILH